MAHAAFDPVWKGGQITRTQAYALLAKSMRIPITECHIGMFDVAQCKAVVALCSSSTKLKRSCYE